jgi:hypothetical protein
MFALSMFNAKNAAFSLQLRFSCLHHFDWMSTVHRFVFHDMWWLSTSFCLEHQLPHIIAVLLSITMASGTEGQCMIPSKMSSLSGILTNAS